MEGKPQMPNNFFDDDDPFRLPRAAMDRMQKMMRGLMTDPFGNMAAPWNPNWMEEDHRPRIRGGSRHRADPADDFTSGPDLIPLKSLTGGDGKVHSYCSRAVVSMTAGEDGKPVVYQAASSTVSAPGGIRETRKAFSDSRKGIKKMHIGRHIGDKGVVIEKERNLVSGEQEDREDYINMNEDEADSFSKEFERMTRSTKQKSYLKPHTRAISRD